MKKNKTKKIICKSLFSFLLIAIPGFLISALASGDLFDSFDLEYHIQIIISIVFIFYSFVITFLFFLLKLTKLSTFSFSVPLAIVFISIYLTDDIYDVISYSKTIGNLIRFTIVLGIIILVIPIFYLINLMVLKYKKKLVQKRK